ncbi:uncharacterized protein TNCV_4591611 [Trichonephila clavipes]|uniref:Mutator-like transposase domain-containing protein n=1 Tax=Trichonephila clavipes TaxID=2585209 RepID=A0A8X6WFU5_TRICX|nr:uncharacterized protein TNCV_4591611 [Trichonephila clavipes]
MGRTEPSLEEPMVLGTVSGNRVRIDFISNEIWMGRERVLSERTPELKLLEAVQLCSEENMKAASTEVQNLKKYNFCGVSVDGTWQRRGHMSLNGCVSVISFDTGKNFRSGRSSGNMEAVRIFERSLIKRDPQYTEYYGDGDSKGFLQVKDIYGENSVTKLECIGHIQKRNYYGITIRSNVGCLEKMQSAVIAAFFHCCSNNQNPMHGKCPTGKDSWCKYKQALFDGKVYVDKTAGLSNSVIKVIKPTYLALCDKGVAKKCLHGKTQNNNESFNNVLWSVLPKEIFCS